MAAKPRFERGMSGPERLRLCRELREKQTPAEQFLWSWCGIAVCGGASSGVSIRSAILQRTFTAQSAGWSLNWMAACMRAKWSGIAIVTP